MKPYYRVCSNETCVAEQFTTLSEAKARAELLAISHSGAAFEILRCVGISQTSQAATFWTDGEGPEERSAGTTAYCRYGVGQTAFYAATSKTPDERGEGPENIIPLPRYRMLEIGEIIERGDEFKNSNGAWCHHNTQVGRKMSRNTLPTRRPL